MTLRIVNEKTDPGAVSVTPLLHRRVAVLGFGNQGSAHALNLRDSGVEVIVGNRANSAGSDRARSAGFRPVAIGEAVSNSDLVIVALPDDVQGDVYREEIEPNLRPGAVLGFLHGFSIHFGLIAPTENAGVILVAPKGPGTTLRAVYEKGRGIPCLFAVHQENTARNAEAIGLAWAAGIACGRSGIIYTTFADETVTDLFGEQAVLCGGLSALILAAFEELVGRGYPPELAYLECCHEVKQIADLIYARGLAGMNDAISTTAEVGAFHAVEAMNDDALREKLKTMLEKIIDGSFAAAMLDDADRGGPWLKDQRTRLRHHEIEGAGNVIRGLMPWLGTSGQ